MTATTLRLLRYEPPPRSLDGSHALPHCEAVAVCQLSLDGQPLDQGTRWWPGMLADRIRRRRQLGLDVSEEESILLGLHEYHAADAASRTSDTIRRHDYAPFFWRRGIAT